MGNLQDMGNLQNARVFTLIINPLRTVSILDNHIYPAYTVGGLCLIHFKLVVFKKKFFFLAKV